MTRGIEHLQKHVIVCGFGRMGQILSQELKRRGEAFVVVDHDNERIVEAQNLDYLAFSGDATEEDVLLSVGVQRAKSLITVLPSDAANVFIALTSRNLNQDLQIIARGEIPSAYKKLIQAGADRVVLPAAIGAQRMAAMVTRPSTVELMDLVAGQSSMDVEIDEVLIGPQSHLVEQSVGQVETRRRHGLLIVAVKQAAGDMVFNPDADFIFQGGDTAIVMGRLEDIERFREEYRV
jgi:voltage-gated potassium channel